MPPVWLLWTLLAINVLTWLAFGLDKMLARRHGGRDDRVAGQHGRWHRIPESWFLWAAALGGYIGAWLAIRFFRHKTRKVSFRWKLIGATAAGVVWMVAGLVLANRS